MAVTFEQFMAAIAGQESGGLSKSAAYSVVNAYGAVGKYQVLKSNIPSWSKAALGYSISWQKFRDSPDLQEKIVRHRLKGYFDKYGARGAASAWYSGNPKLDMSTRKQPGGPSIKEYVDSVMNRAGAINPNDATIFSSGGKPTVPKLSLEELAEQYGYTASMLKAYPELKKLFTQMVSEGMSEAKFKAKLRETKWWKTISEKERQYITLRYTDPATARQNLEFAKVKVMQMAKQMGLTGKYSTWTFLNTYAYNMVAKGWDEGQIRYDLGRYLNPTLATHSGAVGEAWDQLDSYAYGMGVKLSESWYKTRAANIVRGLNTVQDYKNEIDKLAKAQFPQWSAQIDGGQSVADIAQPYFASMAQILELPAGQINLFDPTIRNTLSWTNPSTNKKEAKPMWQFENELRSDPRWKKTKNAQDSLMGVAHQVLADFGVRY